jgi:hypothetical protein
LLNGCHGHRSDPLRNQAPVVETTVLFVAEFWLLPDGHFAVIERQETNNIIYFVGHGVVVIAAPVLAGPAEAATGG